MLTISRWGDGFKVLLSNPGTGQRGFSVKARSLEEVHVAIDHYHMENKLCVHEGNPDCPICRHTMPSLTQKVDHETA